MHAGGRKCQQDVPHSHPVAGNDLRFIHHAEGKTCEVILILGIKAGHFCRFTTDKHTARLHAALCHTFDDGRNFFGYILPRRNIIKEYERLGTRTDDVVDAHRHAVDADRVVQAGEESNLQLGANTVGTAHENRIGNSGQIRLRRSRRYPKGSAHSSYVRYASSSARPPYSRR